MFWGNPKWIPSKDALFDIIQKPSITHATNVMYNSATQQKFNLLREESEGYSLLVAELENGANIKPQNIEEFCSHIQSLIGIGCSALWLIFTRVFRSRPQ